MAQPKGDNRTQRQKFIDAAKERRGQRPRCLPQGRAIGRYGTRQEAQEGGAKRKG